MPVFAGIGVALGVSATAMGGVAAIAVGVVATAVVGAAVGGLTAAVTGGDIGKGMLFGAIGGVATAGIASGLGAATGAFQGGTFGLGLSGQGMAAAGQGTAGYMTQHIASNAAIAPSSSGLFGGGALGNMLNMGTDTLGGQLVTKAIDFAAGAATEDPYNPNMDPEFLRENREDIQGHDKDMAKLTASLRDGGGSSAKLPYQSTEEGYKLGLAEQWKQAKLREDSAMGRLVKQFALQDKSMEKEHDMLTAKFGESAGVAGAQEFQGASDEARAAVLAKQEGTALGGE